MDTIRERSDGCSLNCDARLKETDESDLKWLERVKRERPLQTISYKYLTLQLVRLGVKYLTLFSGRDKFVADQLLKCERGNWMEFLALLDEDRSVRHCGNLR